MLRDAQERSDRHHLRARPDPAGGPRRNAPCPMKIWISIAVAVAAICIFSWMFRYDVQTSILGPVRLDRWTGEVEYFSSDRGWVPYRP